MWKEVRGYEGRYLVSEEGDVFSLYSGKILRHCINQSGYHRVKLYRKNGMLKEKKMFMVHRLVAVAFDPRGEKPGAQVNHIDGNKANNHIRNLEWCTQTENLVHSVRTGLRDMKRCTNATKKAVEQRTLDKQFVKTWDSMSEAARALNIPVGNISYCCAGRIRQAGGFKWNFVI